MWFRALTHPLKMVDRKFKERKRNGGLRGERVPKAERGREKNIQKGGWTTKGNVEIVCGVRTNVLVMVGHFTSQWDRTKRITMLKVEDVNHLSPSTAVVERWNVKIGEKWQIREDQDIEAILRAKCCTASKKEETEGELGSQTTEAYSRTGLTRETYRERRVCVENMYKWQ